MTEFNIRYGLPFVSVSLSANGQIITLPVVLIDTGSAASVFRTDALATIGVVPTGEDNIRFMSGIGGREAVIAKQIDSIEIDDLFVKPFTIQLGSLDYGFAFDGILGSDFLIASGTLLNFKTFTIEHG